MFLPEHRRWKLMVAILTLSLLTIMAGAAVAPALGVIQEYFSGESKMVALHEFLWDSYLKLSHIFNWNAPSDPRCEDFFAGIVLAAIERASLG